MASTLCRGLSRSRSAFGILSKGINRPQSSLFNSRSNMSVNSTPSRSWLLRKSNSPAFNIYARNFSIFFASREEHKSRSCCHGKNNTASSPTTPSKPSENMMHHTNHSHNPNTLAVTDLPFWQDKSVWKRAASNTLRCLIGCSIGDFSAMFYLQAHHPGLPFLAMMAIPMASGITTSLGFETLVLRIKESMSWSQSLKTAWTMSLISMLTMEFVENVVDMYLTKGMMNFHDPYFWLALIPSLLAGFLAPLPYNYYKLKKFGKSCH